MSYSRSPERLESRGLEETIVRNRRFTPDRLAINSCNVNGAGMHKGLRVSSGTSTGRGSVERIAFLTATVAAGSLATFLAT